MGKKHKKADLTQNIGGGGITAMGWKMIGAGIFLLLIGFFVLTQTDPAGKNWASCLSPFMILGAYAIIAAGIMSANH